MATNRGQMLKAADHLSHDARDDLIQIANELDDEDLLMNLRSQLCREGKDADSIIGRLDKFKMYRNGS